METQQPVIRIQNLKKSYGTKEVLKGIDLDIYPGQIIGYIGPNGAGKSTTVKILLGILEDYTGTVEVFGQDLKKQTVAYKHRIGYVPEVSDLYEVLSGEEYLMFLARIYSVPEDTATVRMHHMAQILGIDEALSSRISTYSKGMRQKLMIISSLLHDPEIVFLDEPLSGLDANSAMVIKEVMFGLAKSGKTVFYSSHVMEVVEKISDRILILNDGYVVADGNFETLQANSAALNLEVLFNQLTGFNNHAQLAKEMLSAMNQEV
jgi:ABC-2 type transport system ATP-binding protein